MRFSRDPRILEVIGILVSFVTKIEPRLRVLVHEQWSERPNVAETFVFKDSPLPCVPRLWPEGIGRRTQSKQIHHRQFAVVVPAIRDEAVLRGPAMR